MVFNQFKVNKNYQDLIKYKFNLKKKTQLRNLTPMVDRMNKFLITFKMLRSRAIKILSLARINIWTETCQLKRKVDKKGRRKRSTSRKKTKINNLKQDFFLSSERQEDLTFNSQQTSYLRNCRTMASLPSQLSPSLFCSSEGSSILPCDSPNLHADWSCHCL